VTLRIVLAVCLAYVMVYVWLALKRSDVDRLGRRTQRVIIQPLSVTHPEQPRR
jgi:hypothetical protein